MTHPSGSLIFGASQPSTFEVESQSGARPTLLPALLTAGGRYLRLLWPAFCRSTRVETLEQQSTPYHIDPKLASKPFAVEDYPSGYPRFAALIGSHPDFSLYRRFTALRARMLLLQQYQICVLEKDLEAMDRLDSDKGHEIFLASCRQDENPERKSIIQALDIALAKYGTGKDS